MRVCKPLQQPANCDIDIAMLPQTLQEIVALIGIAPTMALVNAYGGLRIYIPCENRVRSTHPYAQIIGTKNLKRLSRAYGCVHFQLPRATRALLALRNQTIVTAYTSKSARQLAIEFDLTEDQIRRIIQKAGATQSQAKQQISLF